VRLRGVGPGVGRDVSLLTLSWMVLTVPGRLGVGVDGEARAR
jgi:hypothetical protein